MFFSFQIEQDSRLLFVDEEVEENLTIDDDDYQDYSINNEYDFQESMMQNDDDGDDESSAG